MSRLEVKRCYFLAFMLFSEYGDLACDLKYDR